MLADRLRVAEVMILRQQAVTEGFLRRAAHLPNVERLKLPQRSMQRRGVDVLDRERTLPGDNPGIEDRPRRWQRNGTRFVQPQEQAAADHVAQHTVRLPPLPELAEFLRERPP